MNQGEYQKQEPGKLQCDSCQKPSDTLLSVTDEKGRESKRCEGCYKQFWLERGFTV